MINFFKKKQRETAPLVKLEKLRGEDFRKGLEDLKTAVSGLEVRLNQRKAILDKSRGGAQQ